MCCCRSPLSWRGRSFCVYVCTYTTCVEARGCHRMCSSITLYFWDRIFYWTGSSCQQTVRTPLLPSSWCWDWGMCCCAGMRLVRAQVLSHWAVCPAQKRESQAHQYRVWHRVRMLCNKSSRCLRWGFRLWLLLTCRAAFWACSKGEHRGESMQQSKAIHLELETKKECTEAPPTGLSRTVPSVTSHQALPFPSCAKPGDHGFKTWTQTVADFHKGHPRTWEAKAGGAWFGG